MLSYLGQALDLVLDYLFPEPSLFDDLSDDLSDDFVLIGLEPPVPLLCDSLTIDQVFANVKGESAIVELRRRPYLGMASLWLSSSQEFSHYWITLRLQWTDRQRVTIVVNDVTYQWAPATNILYGPDSDLLPHFSNPPVVFRRALVS